MTQVVTFLNDPMVAPLYALLVLCVLDFLLGVYRSIQQHVFDWAKLPQILDTVILQKVIPLAALGVATVTVTDPTAKAALTVAYVGGSAAALAAEVKAFLDKVLGNYTAKPA